MYSFKPNFEIKMKNIINFSIWIFVLLIFVFISSCKKDGIEQEPNTVTDVDGNVYHTVTIGTQVWMAENLKVTHYNNGDVIGNGASSTSRETVRKCQWAYDNDESNVEIYGRLYTWHAATDSRCICPEGWHIPTVEEMNTLREYLITNGYNYDGTTSGNKCAKALASESNWDLIGNEGTPGNTDYPEKRNIAGFNGLPGGGKDVANLFSGKGHSGAWWSSSEYNSDFPWTMCMCSSLPTLYIGPLLPKNFGYSVRCIKD